MESKLCDLARAEIDELTAEGIILLPSEVIEINHLASRVESPHTRLDLARGRPVLIAGVALWPMTLYAADWYCVVGSQLKGIEDLALAYAMAHAYDDDGALLCDERTAPKIIKRWARRIRCTRKSLSEATMQVIEQDEKPPLPQGPDEAPITVGEFSATLAALTNESTEFWERRCAVSYGYSVLATIAMQNHVEKTPCAADPRIEAERALGYAIDKIRKSRKADNA